MRFSILVVVLALMVVPAMAQNYLGPIPGVYKTQFGQVIRTKSFEFLLNKMQEQRRAIQ